ncbi:diaminopimelate epimerase [Hydrogenivirga sp. 128-5-R1-1]|uniref:diaminopimelate epimerase n=1 Tax=Hydrogenivirga sp. 128-5-R1-1 TaxID=392423 RepID=UPI00015EF760|nr:diaminopimelate epimerase [Hydrogenivirga sp. 128-5-R1-1]EDP75627.1 diaminopimelate epimerase [Hydrogenivirga sp. 128-5-R1-1]
MDFAKLQGSGNDFILIDNRDGKVYRKIEELGVCLKEFILKLCEPHRGVGADGLILIEEPEDNANDFRWQFFNSDGSEAEMCGNGSRCAVRFCYDLGIVDDRVSFETLAGVIRAEVLEGGKRVKVQLTPPSEPLEKTLRVEGTDLEGVFINTGVPHFVVPVKDIDKVDVKKLGRAIRFHEEFQPKGTNVNFIEAVAEDTIKIRTYERGVESETLACGTGATAGAIVAYLKGLVSRKPVQVITKSEEVLGVDFDENFREVFLNGAVYKVFEGTLSYDVFT